MTDKPCWDGYDGDKIPSPSVEDVRKAMVMPAVPKQGGTKADEDKPRTDLVPIKAVLRIAEVMGFGAKKYDAYNWRRGIKFSRLFGACQRHLLAYWDGEDIDPESGLHHMAHAGCCITMLLTLIEERPDLDDRFKEHLDAKEG